MTDVVQAMIGRLNARGNISVSDIETLLDMLIAEKSAEFVREMQQDGLSPHEVETSIEIQGELIREWRAETLREVHETFFGGSEQQ
jgi:hypothetical protein